VNYYKRHLGDYAKDTSWLSTYQHGVYALLLDWYYSNERAIPMNLVHRIVKARTGPEKRATDEVLQTFFDMSKEAGFAHNKHADEVLGNYKTKSEVNSLIAKERESTKRARNVGEVVVDSSNSGEPIHKPLTISHKEAKASLPPDGCPHAEIIDLYHDTLPANPRIKSWTGKRQANLRTRWREDSKRQNLGYWSRYFAHVAASPFLTGQRADRQGRPFLPGLDWLVMPENFAKVIEGRYHDKGAE
jgi:uncharacterized protein YdaU (DUF1376 family)